MNLLLRRDRAHKARISRMLGSPLARGYRMECHKSLPSTNTYLKELAGRGADTGLVVIAESQSGGRGRMGRSFYSPDGSGIYMSILLPPLKSTEDTTKITAFAAVCVSEAIDSLYSVKSEIKWVNDIILSGKKVCGILTESVFDSSKSKISHVVLGIGINKKRAPFPDELSSIAGSIENYSAERHTKDALIARILTGLSPLLSGEIPADTMDRYRSRSNLLGKEVFTLTSPEISGLAAEISDKGELVIKDSLGTLHRIGAGEVSVREKK